MLYVNGSHYDSLVPASRRPGPVRRRPTAWESARFPPAGAPLVLPSSPALKPHRPTARLPQNNAPATHGRATPTALCSRTAPRLPKGSSVAAATPRPTQGLRPLPNAPSLLSSQPERRGRGKRRNSAPVAPNPPAKRRKGPRPGRVSVAAFEQLQAKVLTLRRQCGLPCPTLVSTEPHPSNPTGNSTPIGPLPTLPGCPPTRVPMAPQAAPAPTSQAPTVSHEVLMALIRKNLSANQNSGILHGVSGAPSGAPNGARPGAHGGWRRVAGAGWRAQGGGRRVAGAGWWA